MNELIILTAFALDLTLGDPARLPHPVRLIGGMIRAAEKTLRGFTSSPASEKAAGLFLVIAIVLPVYAISHIIILYAFKASSLTGIFVSALMAYFTLAARGLGDAATAVLRRLDAGDAAGARTELSMVVGRDTENLDEREIVRAAVETTAENTSDGVVAPLFYLALGGPALAMAYKAINTLDSMVGYRNERYLYFGRASAKMDDVANFIPSRITAALICLAAGLLPGFSCGRALKILFRDGRSHPSPNSGYPEAAMAGALGVRFGGPSTYAGRISQKPYIGDDINDLHKKNIALSVRLMYCCSVLSALLSAFFSALH